MYAKSWRAWNNIATQGSMGRYLIVSIDFRLYAYIAVQGTQWPVDYAGHSYMLLLSMAVHLPSSKDTAMSAALPCHRASTHKDA